MAAFRFSLQAVLDRRTAVETERRQAMLLAQHAAAREAARLRALAADLRRCALTPADAATDHEPGGVRRKLVEAELVRAALERQQRVSVQASQAADTAREAFLAARSERTQLQSLRDLTYRTFAERQDLREAAELDESNAKSDIISP